MSGASVRMRDVGVMTATTVGAGIFSLPYVFKEAGLFAGAFYLLVLSCIVISVHFLYWEVLKRTGGGLRLLGLAREYGGLVGYGVAFGAIIIGLLLTLVAYIILGGEFLSLIFPSLSREGSAVLFWFLSTIPLLLKDRRLLGFEVVGAWFIIAAVGFVFIKGFGNSGGFFLNLPAFVPENFFLPFGPVLFSLAGWTAIEPLFDEEKKDHATPLSAAKSLTIGTFFSAFLYAAFVGGIFGSVSQITPDTVSGLLASGWSAVALAVIGILGIFAIWTSYLPVAIEIRNSLVRDCQWKKNLALSVVGSLPLILFGMGFTHFLGVLSLAGGVFVSIQYFIILFVGMKVLKPRGVAKTAFVLLSAVFAFAAVYSAAQFVVR